MPFGKISRATLSQMEKDTLSKNEKKQVTKIANSAIRKVKTTKIYDRETSLSSIDSSGTIFDLSIVTCETGKNRVIPVKLEFRGTIQLGDPSPNAMRLIFFVYKNDATDDGPIATEILDQLAGAQAPFGMRNREHYGKYHVLLDRMYVLDTYNPVKLLKFTFPKKKLPSKMTGNSSAIHTNKVYLLAVSDDSLTDYPDIRFVSRLQYYED